VFSLLALEQKQQKKQTAGDTAEIQGDELVASEQGQ
jgi:hypothetical protein